MNVIVPIETCTALVDRAASALQGARSSAEVLDAIDMASLAYDANKKAARIMRVRGAHDELIAAAHRAQADALEIEAKAKRRLADEYDAAQGRGEIRANGDKSFSGKEKLSGPEIVPPKDLHEARIVRDAEENEPGVIRRALDEVLEAGEEPTKAHVKRAALKATKRTRGKRFEAPKESQHDRDLKMLFGAWEAACATAREEFLEKII